MRPHQGKLVGNTGPVEKTGRPGSGRRPVHHRRMCLPRICGFADPDADLGLGIVALCQSMQRLARQIFLRDLALKLDARSFHSAETCCVGAPLTCRRARYFLMQEASRN